MLGFNNSAFEIPILVPTPFGLVTRLNGVAGRMAGFLNGTTWRPNIYTSKWGRAYMKTLKKS